jgi:hypothetical protein
MVLPWHDKTRFCGVAGIRVLSCPVIDGWLSCWCVASPLVTILRLGVEFVQGRARYYDCVSRILVQVVQSC